MNKYLQANGDDHEGKSSTQIFTRKLNSFEENATMQPIIQSQCQHMYEAASTNKKIRYTCKKSNNKPCRTFPKHLIVFGPFFAKAIPMSVIACGYWVHA